MNTSTVTPVSISVIPACMKKNKEEVTMGKIQKAYNGSAPMQAEYTVKPNVPPAEVSVAMEIAGAEAMLGFNPRPADDDYEEDSYEDMDVF